MYRILESIVLSIAAAAKNTYPAEFISLLGWDEEKKLIDEIVAVPADYGKNFSTIYTHLVPFDSRIIGSVHSHPSPSYKPSRGDLRSFAKLGEIHFIIAYPFNIDNLAAYDINGKPVEFEVVGNE
jgi:proteasome lid subunit RPN8/RPN11